MELEVTYQRILCLYFVIFVIYISLTLIFIISRIKFLVSFDSIIVIDFVTLYFLHLYISVVALVWVITLFRLEYVNK